VTGIEVPFVWEKAQEESFQAIKNAMIKEPFLTLPNPDYKLVLEVDGCLDGLGAVLSQHKPDSSVLLPIAYLSRVLNALERSYSIREIECLAIVWSIKMLRYYLTGVQFKDHGSLQWLWNWKNAPARVLRWWAQIQSFSFEVEYRPGAQNVVADALSRAPASSPIVMAVERKVINATEMKQRYLIEQNSNKLDLKVDFPSLANWKLEIKEDLVWKRIVLHLSGEMVVTSNVKDWNVFKKRIEHFKLQDGFLFFLPPGGATPRYVVPTKHIQAVLTIFHTVPISGHVGQRRMRAQIGRLFWWNSWTTDVRKFVRRCYDCIRVKSVRGVRNVPILPKQLMTVPFEVVHCDFYGPIDPPSQGKEYLLC